MRLGGGGRGGSTRRKVIFRGIALLRTGKHDGILVGGGVGGGLRFDGRRRDLFPPGFGFKYQEPSNARPSPFWGFHYLWGEIASACGG